MSSDPSGHSNLANCCSVLWQWWGTASALKTCYLPEKKAVFCLLLKFFKAKMAAGNIITGAIYLIHKQNRRKSVVTLGKSKGKTPPISRHTRRRGDCVRWRGEILMCAFPPRKLIRKFPRITTGCETETMFATLAYRQHQCHHKMVAKKVFTEGGDDNAPLKASITKAYSKYVICFTCWASARKVASRVFSITETRMHRRTY